MNIFWLKTRKKHIEKFVVTIANLLESELPQIKKATSLSKVYGISFIKKPEGIYVFLGYSPEDFEIISKNHRTCFNLNGISVFNKKKNSYQSIKLYFQSDGLTRIEVENPEYFHRTFDLNKIQVNSLEIIHLNIENPDKEIAEKALKSLTEAQIDLLELDFAFEIEIEGKLFYTILDMEDGNYIAVDKKGKIFRLNHDHNERVKLIANNPSDFFNFYKGQKSELEKIMYE